MTLRFTNTRTNEVRRAELCPAVAKLGFLVLSFFLVATCSVARLQAPQLTPQKAQTLVAGVAASPARDGGNTSAQPDAVAPDNDFKIGPDDTLAVSVWGEPEVSQTIPVRPDGKISLPLVGEVVASGKTAKQLEAIITQQLSNYLSLPQVTVIVREVKSQRIVVAGQVAKPGSYQLLNSMSVLDAIAQAGGPLEYAKVRGIYVLRIGADGKPTRLKFNYQQVIHGQNLAQNIRLQSHDTVVVP